MSKIIKNPFVIIPCVIVLLLCSLFVFLRPQSEYNTNPNLSSKIVGSHNLQMDHKVRTSMNDYYESADLVIIGTVLDNGVDYKFNNSANDEMAKAMLAKGEDPYMDCTLSQVKIDQIIAGKKPDTDTIKLFQLGKPQVPDMQTKVKKSDKLYMILSQFETPGEYKAVLLESSLFYLDKNNKLTSMSDDQLCARYDGLPLQKLIDDMKATDNYKSKLSKNN